MAERQEAVVRRMLETVWNTGNLNTLDEFFTTDYVHHDPINPIHGIDGYRALVSKYRTAFPDCRLDVDECFSIGDRVVLRWRYSGTHKGPLEGIAPTGRHVSGTGISISRMLGDRIHESLVEWDTLGMLQQLGVVTMPGRAAAAGA